MEFFRGGRSYLQALQRRDDVNDRERENDGMRSDASDAVIPMWHYKAL